MRRIRVPSDVAAVLELYKQLGHAARQGLWLAEKRTEAEVRQAARAADALHRRGSR